MAATNEVKETYELIIHGKNGSDYTTISHDEYVEIMHIIMGIGHKSSIRSTVSAKEDTITPLSHI